MLADQLDAVERVSRDRGLDAADLALLTDGLRAEREQGITIDVAYRYFSTATRSYVLADTPGHVQYTRNMVTGASTAELALILIDARHGVVEQTRRHLAVTGLLGVRHVARGRQQDGPRRLGRRTRFDDDRRRVRRATQRGSASRTSSPCPSRRCSATTSCDRSDRAAWYTGPTLLEHLESVPVGTDPSAQPLRMPVQYVIRPQSAGAPRTTAGMPVGWPPASSAPATRSSSCPAVRRTTVAGIDRARADGSLE